METIKKLLRYIYIVLQWAFCLLCWLVLPPVLLFLYKPIRSKWIRLTLALISPIMILLYVELYHICERRYRYNNPNEIEAIVAGHCGMQVVGVSCITNMAAGVLPVKLSHEEVTETANNVKEVFQKLVDLIVGIV